MLYAAGAGSRTLSYQTAWPRAFRAHPRLACVPVDVTSRSASLRVRAAARRERLDSVVLLHSVFSNSCLVGRRLADAIGSLPQPKALFVGNEYKLMPEKLAFAEAIDVSLLVTQLPAPEVRAQYAERLRCAVAYVPSAALDPDAFAPRTPRAERPLDLGYRAHPNPLYLGHDERRLVAERVGGAARRHGLRVDISLDPADRLPEDGWAAFLDACRGQLGSEAGSDYFELTDETRHRVNDFLERHPETGPDEVFERFFRAYERPVSGRTLSSRIVEAAGTKTVQLLLEGDYAGLFEPDVHYIPVRKDFSNVDEALDRLLDAAHAAAVADRAYELAVSELTYRRLIDRFVAALEPLL